MISHHPAWTAFDPGAPPSLPEPEGPEGRVVAVVATEGAALGAWAADVATDLARAWSATGLRVVLVDGGLERPCLHTGLGVPNGEGLSDALLWGASVRRVAWRPEGDRFFMVTAGTVVADPAAALASPKWSHLCSGFRDAGVTMVVFTDAGQAGSDRVLGEADDVVVLATPDEDPSAVGDVVGRVRAVVGSGAGDAVMPSPETHTAEEPPTTDGEVAEDALATQLSDPIDGGQATQLLDPLEDSEVTRLLDPLEDAQTEPLLDPADSAGSEADQTAEAGGTPTFEEIVEESETVLPAAAPSEGRRNGLLVLLLVLLVAVLVAAWLGYVDIPGITPTGGDAAPPVSATPAEVVREAPTEAVEVTPMQDLVGYSVALGAYQDGSVAQSRAENLSALESGFLVASVPVEVEGTLYYRVLAGPATDSADASRLAGRLAVAAGTDPSGWVIRATPRAFHLAEMPMLEDAQLQAEVLQGLDLPAYVLAVDYSDGSTSYRVYAGAYADANEASYLGALLSERGLGSTLIDRIGRLPA